MLHTVNSYWWTIIYVLIRKGIKDICDTVKKLANMYLKSEKKETEKVAFVEEILAESFQKLWYNQDIVLIISL